jgi:hypothetical protein
VHRARRARQVKVGDSLEIVGLKPRRHDDDLHRRRDVPEDARLWRSR